MKIQLRYNTETGDSNLKWRIIIDGHEYLAANVFFNCPCRTSSDIMPEVGLKHHVSCETNMIQWDGKNVYVG